MKAYYTGMSNVCVRDEFGRTLVDPMVRRDNGDRNGNAVGARGGREAGYLFFISLSLSLSL